MVPSDLSFESDVHLAYGDVRVDDVSSPSYVEVYLKASKTDPFRLGVSVFLAGHMSLYVHWQHAVLVYIVDCGHDLGPFFRFEDGRFLTRDHFVSTVRTALTAAGVEAARYLGH